MKKFNKIYVLCPYGLVTGGPDALHQLVYYLRGIGCDAEIVYSDIRSHKYEIPTPYKCYVEDYSLVKDIKDTADSAIIVPETLTFFLDNYKNLKKYVWWLSVNNNTENSGFSKKVKKIFKKISIKTLFKQPYKLRTLNHYIKNKKYEFKDNTVVHLCASYYAYDYVESTLKVNSDIRQEYCIEPISKYFLENRGSGERADIVIYNPKKNFEFTSKIIAAAPDINFVPLRGFTQEGLVDIYSRSKVYIDFGWFPGAERIPKEAVLNGCLIITGKNGASAFHGDVAIPDEYKIESKDENIDSIVEMIRLCLKEYKERIPDFEEYRNTVLNLENGFIQSLRREFTEEAI